ncbi:MAG: phenylalanine--tRNA ligase beta subunit-related protein [Candidatus Bathyarchaeota archaeon]|nr:phenylalanine--tRNA ligase beta subunit-related protein [Candidatus Bathyarchaeum sp.]
MTGKKKKMNIQIDSQLRTRFPDLAAIIVHIDGVNIQKRIPDLENFKLEVIKQTNQDFDLESLKDQPTFRAYRDFFWAIKIDPTKNRPASEALTRRILAGKPIPCINTLVDAYNLASITSKTPIATFDSDKLEGEIFMRFAKQGEEIMGIGMKKPMMLQGGEIVISDEKKLVAVYPYRDSDNTKVTEKTKNVTIVACGAPKIPIENLQKASKTAIDYVMRFCGGKFLNN